MNILETMGLKKSPEKNYDSQPVNDQKLAQRIDRRRAVGTVDLQEVAQEQGFVSEGKPLGAPLLDDTNWKKEQTAPTTTENSAVLQERSKAVPEIQNQEQEAKAKNGKEGKASAPEPNKKKFRVSHLLEVPELVQQPGETVTQFQVRKLKAEAQAMQRLVADAEKRAQKEARKEEIRQRKAEKTKVLRALGKEHPSETRKKIAGGGLLIVAGLDSLLRADQNENPGNDTFELAGLLIVAGRKFRSATNEQREEWRKLGAEELTRRANEKKAKSGGSNA